MTINAVEEKLWTVKQVAATLKVSVRQVHRLSMEGLMPAPIRLGGSIRWSKDEILSWLEAGAPDRDKWSQIRTQGQGQCK